MASQGIAENLAHSIDSGTYRGETYQRGKFIEVFLKSGS